MPWRRADYPADWCDVIRPAIMARAQNHCEGSPAHIPPDYVVERVIVHRKPPEVRICRLSIQSDVGTRPPSTSTPPLPAFRARR